jgi:hypothetical protein
VEYFVEGDELVPAFAFGTRRVIDEHVHSERFPQPDDFAAYVACADDAECVLFKREACLCGNGGKGGGDVLVYGA